MAKLGGRVPSPLSSHIARWNNPQRWFDMAPDPTLDLGIETQVKGRAKMAESESVAAIIRGGRSMHRSVRTKTLDIAYLESGPEDGPPVVLLHGWPSDVHDWDGVVPLLTTHGFRSFVPWLRGFGPTSFLNPSTPRSGQQAALGSDLRDFMDALGIPAAILVGYDWGGRAACVVAALWPERVVGLVSINGYNIQNIATTNRPATAEQEQRYWYQWYFHTERGIAGLTQNRRAIARLLWRLWSPNWKFA
jgi:pimeloyl-ACP methyl ester carboxylesterase